MLQSNSTPVLNTERRPRLALRAGRDADVLPSQVRTNLSEWLTRRAANTRLGVMPW